MSYSSYIRPILRRLFVFVYSCIRGIRRFSEIIVVFLFICLYRRMCGSTVDGTVILEEIYELFEASSVLASTKNRILYIVNK